MTASESFRRDSHTLSGIDSILAALASHQESLTGIRPPDPALAGQYQKDLGHFASLRGGKLFLPYLASGMGRGPLVELADGSVKYDMTCGIGVHIMGHSHPRMIRAALEAALEDVVMQGNIQQNKHSMTLCERLLAIARRGGAALDHCFLTSSGVMAGENALKIALQKKAPASRVIAFERCFSGRTLTFSQINDKPAFRDGLPATMHVDYVPFYDESDPEGSTRRAILTLESHLRRYPGRHAAMLFELIQGEGGFYPGCEDFHRRLMSLCREHGVAVLVDEVQTFARTHQPFAFQHFGLDDLVDIVWIGKAAQVCATFFGTNWAPRPGLIAQTYTASSSTIAASLAVLDEMEEGGWFGEDGKTARLHAFFQSRLKAISARHPGLLEGPWGLGAMTGCTALGGDPENVTDLLAALYGKGVIAFPSGVPPLRIRFLLPVGTLEEEHIADITSVFEETLAKHKGISGNLLASQERRGNFRVQGEARPRYP